MRTNDEQQFGELLGGVYKTLKISEKAIEHRVIQAWETLFGATFASHISTLTYSHHELTVKITSDVLRHELFLNRTKMRNRLNEELGEQLIKEIILK